MPLAAPAPAAAERPAAEALEAHLQALARALDLQADLLRGALGLLPAVSPPAGTPLRQGPADDAVSKFDAAVGTLRSDLAAMAAAGAGQGVLAATAAAKGPLGRAGSGPCASPRRSSVGSAASGRSGGSQPGTPRSSGEENCEITIRESRKSAAAGSAASASVGVPDTPYLMQVESASNHQRHASVCIDGVLNPEWPPRFAWDLLVLILVLCDSVVIPFQLAEFGTAPGFDDFWLWLTFCIFLSDMVMNFFTGYRSEKNDKRRPEGTLVTKKASVVVHYLRGWFWIDFMGTVPWQVIAGACMPDTDTQLTVKAAKVVKLTRLLRLMRVLRLLKLTVNFERFEGHIGSITALNVMSLIKVIAVWAAICHWGACFWWMVGKRNSLVMILTSQDDRPDGLHWTELPRRHSTHDDFGVWTWVQRPASEQYAFCFYWILGVMRTMPAEVTPVNQVERVFVLIFMFFAILAFAINVARLTQAWFKFSARREAFKEEMAYLRMHLKETECGTSLQLRAQAYLMHLFQKRKLHAKEAGLLNVLPEGLKLQIRNACVTPHLRKISRFQDWSESALRRVCGCTQAVDYLTGDKVTEKGSDAETAYVLMRGAIQVYVPLREESRATTSSKLPRITLSSTQTSAPLQVVDEHCLFADPGQNVFSRDTVIAMECSEVLCIDRRRFQEVLQRMNPASFF